MTAILAAFAYDDLPEPVAIRLRGQADRIRARNAGIVEAMIETGRDLLAVKGSIPHGTFAQWVETECGLSPRMAQLYMQASTWAEGENAKLISHFQPTALMKVAAKSTPDEVRQTFVEQARQGVAVSTKEVDAALFAAREKRKELEKEAATSPAARKRRRERAEAEAAARAKHQEIRQAKCEEAERLSAELADIIAENLSEAQISRVIEILRNDGVFEPIPPYLPGSRRINVALQSIVKQPAVATVADDADLFTPPAHIAGTAREIRV